MRKSNVIATTFILLIIIAAVILIVKIAPLLFWIILGFIKEAG